MDLPMAAPSEGTACRTTNVIPQVFIVTCNEANELLAIQATERSSVRLRWM
jgi:hypothetical protein